MSGVDRELLHRYLWDHSDRQGMIRVHQGGLADKLEVNKFTMSRIFAELIEAGRLKRLAVHQGNFRTYAVTDPDTFVPKEKAHV